MKLIFCIALLYALPSWAQKDPCSKITKKEQELEGITTYMTPYFYSVQNIDIFGVKKVVDKKPFLSFMISMNHTVLDYHAKGIYIKFDNGEIIKMPDQKIDCNYDDGWYHYFAAFLITDETKDLFTYHKIVKVAMNGDEREVSDKVAQNFIDYLPCLISKLN